jgi:hypothetical protein
LLTFSSPSRSPPSPSPSSSSSSLGFGTMRLKGKKNGKFHFLRIIMTDRITFGSHLFLKKLVFPIFWMFFSFSLTKDFDNRPKKCPKKSFVFMEFGISPKMNWYSKKLICILEKCFSTFSSLNILIYKIGSYFQ